MSNFEFSSFIDLHAWTFVNLLYLLPRIPFPLNDGGAVATYNQLLYLRRAGHEVHVLALNPLKFRQPASVMDAVCDQIDTVELNTNPRPIAAAIHFFSVIPYKYRRFYSKEMLGKLEQVLAERQFDLIVLDQTPMTLYARDIRRMCSTPIVHRNHNVEHILLQRMAQGSHNPLMSWYLGRMVEQTKKMEQEFYALCDGVTPMTEPDAERLRALGYSGHVRAIPLGVDVNTFKPNSVIIPQKNTLVYFGSFDWYPNADAAHWLAREIFPAIKRKHPTLQLHLGGKSPSDEILAYASQEDISVHANVPSAADFLQTYDILLVPLRIGGGMRVKIVEAMASHRAIVSTSIGAEGIKIRDGENILLADSVDQFVSAVDRLLTDATLKADIASAARTSAVDEYSWESLTAVTLDYFSSIIARKT